MQTPYFEHFPISSTGLPHMDPIMGGAQQCRAGYTYGPVMRQYYILEYVCRGKGEYTVNGQTYAASAGEAFLIRPYEVHLLRADKEEPWEYIWIGFSTDLTLPKLLLENYVFDASGLADIFTAMRERAAEKRSAADYAADLYTIFARLYAAETQPERVSEDPIDRAVAIIQKEYATITVQMLADRLFLNRSYFGAQFKKRTGKSPKIYIDECRLSAATKLMHALGYTATQAAHATGYGDVMAFSKMYKRHYGISPRQAAGRMPRAKTIHLR